MAIKFKNIYTFKNVVNPVVKKIDISDEDILNLKHALKKLIPVSDPAVDFGPLTIRAIIDRWEEN